MRIHSDYFWYALDYFVAGCCIAQSNCSWDVDFSSSHMGDEKTTQFLQALSSTNGGQKNTHITSINWSGNKLTSRGLCHLQDIPAHFLHYLRSFNLSHNSLNCNAVEYIAKTIPHMPQLEELRLRGNRDIQRGGTVSLVSALCDHKNLEKSRFVLY